MKKVPGGSIFTLIILLVLTPNVLSTNMGGIYIPEPVDAPVFDDNTYLSMPAVEFSDDSDYSDDFRDDELFLPVSFDTLYSVNLSEAVTDDPENEPAYEIDFDTEFNLEPFPDYELITEPEPATDTGFEQDQETNPALTPEPVTDDDSVPLISGPPADGTYTVVPGDTLGSIAYMFRTSAAYLAQLNNLPDPDSIIIGQVLSVPNSDNPLTAPELSPAPVPAPETGHEPESGPDPDSEPEPSSAVGDVILPGTYTDAQMLARVIHYESHWEEYNSKLAVGQCVIDRWQNTTRASGQSSAWNTGGAKSLQDIITAPYQFGLSDFDRVCDNCLQAAADALSGTRAFADNIITNFRRSTSTNDWNAVPYVGHIGGQAFYGYPR